MSLTIDLCHKRAILEKKFNSRSRNLPNTVMVKVNNLIYFSSICEEVYRKNIPIWKSKQCCQSYMEAVSLVLFFHVL